MSTAGVVVLLLLLNLIFLAAPLPQTEATFKIGAWGDDSSRNNQGVQVEIETHSSTTPNNTLDYFWAGNDLSDGAFIQFGYSLEPGAYCLKGSVKASELTCLGSTQTISGVDARWQWQYWPDRFSPDYYYEIGPQGSAGHNASMHVYAILPSPEGKWEFAMDGKVVENTSFPVSRSADPVFIVAEGTASNVSQTLGPVRFGNLSYLGGSEWRQVESLIALSYCGISVACAASEYGVTAVGANAILAGSGIPRSDDGTLLWTSGLARLEVSVHPGVQFVVTSPLGASSYDGSATAQLPQGMFAYVSLADPVTSTPGILGWMGGQDRFQGWTGSVNSKNLTARVLMDSNKVVTATWDTDYSTPALFAILAVAAALILVGVARRRSGSESSEQA
jgi:hypothetical protein